MYQSLASFGIDLRKLNICDADEDLEGIKTECWETVLLEQDEKDILQDLLVATEEAQHFDNDIEAYCKEEETKHLKKRKFTTQRCLKCGCLRRGVITFENLPKTLQVLEKCSGNRVTYCPKVQRKTMMTLVVN